MSSETEGMEDTARQFSGRLPRGRDDQVRHDRENPGIVISEDAKIVAKFESLGDNCEFGFVQRHHGLEPGGLLRWASSTTLDGLVQALECRFAGLYQLDDLSPYTANMVVDCKFGIAFHSA